MVDISESPGTLRSEPYPAIANGADVPVLVRLMTEDDLPWLKDLCLRRYSHRYEPESTENWFRQLVLKNPLLFLAIRTDNAFSISLISCLPWLPSEFEVNVIFLCAEHGEMWQALKLCRYSIDWARRRKCHVWRLASETGYDLSMISKRLGCKELTARYSLRL